jgi:hypothetical protein
MMLHPGILHRRVAQRKAASLPASVNRRWPARESCMTIAPRLGPELGKDASSSPAALVEVG